MMRLSTVLRALVALAALCVAPSVAHAQADCATRVGPFAWSCRGPVAGMACTQILETADPYTWNDNYFCSDQDYGIRWSSAGPIQGMRCTQILETADPHTWSNNYLCVPPMLPVYFVWNSAGRVPGLPCVQWSEPSDPNSWNDNFLCWSDRLAGAPTPVATPVPVNCERRNGPFAWNCTSPVQGMACTQIVEPADPHSWNDNYFCAAQDIGIRWSSAGAIPGMRCTLILETSDPNSWNDNYLCVPPQSPYFFLWNSAGPVLGAECVQWLEPSDPNTWSDNYLCWPPRR